MALGLVTIGQTPRPDLEQVFHTYVPGVTISLIGALDGLSREQIHQLRGNAGECPLLCKLQDGSVDEVSLPALTPYIEHAAHRLAEQGAQLIVVLCTGAFPEIACSVPVLLPGRVLPAVVQGISRTWHIAVVTSVEGQVPFAQAKWEEAGFRSDTTWASPYLVEHTKKALNELRHSQAEMVILDCFGHDDAYRRVFVHAMHRPVLVAQTLIARIAGEILSQ